jgi:hypothetical protein
VLKYDFTGAFLASGFKDRNSARTKVSIEGFYNFSARWFPCTLQDLSTEGAGLKINQNFVPGDLIQLKFGFRGEERVFETTVVNVNGTRIGVHFSVDALTREFLQNLIQA